jgi:aminoglycoside phosphotransferase (APT) family kinase protein
VSVDVGAGVRAGEELNEDAVDAWLKTRVDGLRGAPKITQYSGGASNWTYRLEYESHDLVLRRPPKGTKAKSAHDMGREYKIQKALRPAFPYVPEMIAFCDDPAVIGAEFYVMRRINGLIPRARMPDEVPKDPASIRTLCRRVVHVLAELHQVDVNATGLAVLSKGKGYPRRQIEGWSERYDKARTWNVPKFGKVVRWLKANIPDDAGTCLIHNDYRFDNLILDPADPLRIIGVLDWELATVGDPLMELGSALAYWVQADDDFIAKKTRRQPTHLPGMLARQAFVAAYCEATGRGAIDNWVFYEVYGLFRLAGILQQIYYRYHHGQTRNPAFKNLWLLANYLHWRCLAAIRGR